MVGVRAADRPPVAGERGERLVGAAGLGEGEGHGDGREARPRLKTVRPAVPDVGGTGQGQESRVHVLPAVPLPAAAVGLQLPQPGPPRLAVAQRAHRQVTAAGAGTLPGDGEGPHAVGLVDAAVDVRDGLAQRAPLPAVLVHPVALRPQQVRGHQLSRVRGEDAEDEGSDRLQVERVAAPVAQLHVCTQDRDAVGRAVDHVSGEVRLGVVQADGQLVPVPVAPGVVAEVAQPCADTVDQAPARRVRALGAHDGLDQRQRLLEPAGLGTVSGAPR